MKIAKPALSVWFLSVLLFFILSTKCTVAQQSPFSGPDLEIMKMWVVPSPPKVGQEATIYARVGNKGDEVTTAPITVRFTVAGKILRYPPSDYGTPQGPPLHPPILPGYTMEAFARWTPAYPGEDICIRAHADYEPRPSGQILEGDESNNTMELYVDVLLAGEEAPSTEELEPVPESEPVGADVELLPGTLEFSAPSFTTGQEIKIVAKVKNTGTKKLAPVEVEFWADEYRIGEDKVHALNPGDKKRFIIYWTPTSPGQYNIHAVVDPRGRFNERDEGNNRDDRLLIIND